MILKYQVVGHEIQATAKQTYPTLQENLTAAISMRYFESDPSPSPNPLFTANYIGEGLQLLPFQV